MTTAHEWVSAFLDRAEAGLDIDRINQQAPGFDASGVLEILEDDRLGPQVIEAMSDLMHPTDSMYYDAIFGAFHGQAAIRNWLVPTMTDISFIEFVPTAATEVFEHAEGTSSIDEWQMWANLGDERMPLPRGISTRHYTNGWVTWNADVYDTNPMRRPATDPDAEAAPLPDPPNTPWTTAAMQAPPRSPALDAWLQTPTAERGPLDHADIHTVMVTPELGLDVEVMGRLFHPTESQLIEPTATYEGAAAIGAHLERRRNDRVSLTLEAVGPQLFNGNCTAFEWVARSDGSHPVRGTSVCRYRDGMIVYAADYYDTAPAG